MTDWITALAAQVFSYVLVVPFLVPLILRAAAVTRDKFGRWGNQWVLIALGCYLFVFQMIIYILQYVINTPRPNPFAPSQVYYGFPSEITFYTTIFVTFIVEFTLVWNIQFSVVYWAELLLCLIVPPAILLWVGFNTWQEILLSFGIGTGCVTLFITMVRLYFMHELPFLLNCAPWSWFSCVDTWIQSQQGQAETEHVRKCLEQIRHLEPRPTGPGYLFRSLY